MGRLERDEEPRVPASRYPKMAAARERRRVLAGETPGRSSAILDSKDGQPLDHRTVRDAAGADHQAAPDGRHSPTRTAGPAAPTGPSGP